MQDDMNGQDIPTEEVRKRFLQYDIRQHGKLEIPNQFEKASVLVPLFKCQQEWHVLLTVRASHMRSQAGDVAFPGGKQDPEDHDDITTALREAKEEIGLDSEKVEVISVLPVSFVRPNKIVSVVVGVIRERFELSVNKREVQRVFKLPLSRFLKDDYTLSDFKAWEEGQTFSIYSFHDMIDGISTRTWGFTAIYCLQVAVILHQDSKKRIYFSPEAYQTLDCLWLSPRASLIVDYLLYVSGQNKL